MPVINDQYELVAVSKLQPHPKNPRRGNIELLRESIRANGFYGAVVVQRSTGFILAGNHRFLAAKEEGLESVPTLWVDCDDAAAARILAVDNRSSDLATYDYKELTSLLAEIAAESDGLIGTGYGEDDLERLLASFPSSDELVRESTGDDLPPKELPPLISYYGGKGRLARRILGLMPKHTVYVEPFSGGLAVFFAKGRPDLSFQDYREVINDKDKRIVTLYRVAQRQPQEFADYLSRTPYSRDFYEEACDVVKNTWDEHSELHQAWAVYVSIMHSFAHILAGSWAQGTYGSNRAATFQNKLQILPEQLKRFEGVSIDNRDALDLIDAWDSPQTLFYCDPPYPESDQGHYAGYTVDDFKRLVEKLKTIQGSFLLSCYDVCEMPPEWERFEFTAQCSASGKGQTEKGRDKSRRASKEELGDRSRTEVVWRKINRTVRPEIQAIYDSPALSQYV